MIDQAADLSPALGLNYSEFPNSCPWVEFPLVVNIAQMLACGGNGDTEQFSDETLGEPDGDLMKSWS